MSDWIDVATVDAFEADGHRVVKLYDVEIAVFNLHDGYFAIEDLCTHDFESLTEGCLACVQNVSTNTSLACR